MGTMLFSSGLEFGDPPEVWNIAHPDIIRRVHRGYLDAGSRIILTNTFGGSRFRLEMHGNASRIDELNRTAAILLRSEVDAAATGALVAGDIGPSGQIMAPLGTLDYDDAVDGFAEQARALAAGGVDVIWIETMSALDEIHAAIEGARQAAPGAADHRHDDLRHPRPDDDGRDPGSGRGGLAGLGRRRHRRQLRQRPR